jgi:vacuolar-type H+-ATPase subunit I/STV1
MTDAKAPPAKNAPPSPGEREAASQPEQPAEDVSTRIDRLREEIQTTELELRIISGKIANRDPALKARLLKENAELKTRVEQLQQALFAITLERFRPREPAEARQLCEVLRLVTVSYCKTADIDQQIWKSIES